MHLWVCNLIIDFSKFRDLCFELQCENLEIVLFSLVPLRPRAIISARIFTFFRRIEMRTEQNELIVKVKIRNYFLKKSFSIKRFVQNEIAFSGPRGQRAG